MLRDWPGRLRQLRGAGRPQGPGRRHRCHGARLVGALGLAELNFICETLSESFIAIGIDLLHIVY